MGDMSLPPDVEIVAALKTGDERVFETVFRHFYAALCRFAVTVLNDKDEAEDVVQQVMVQIWEKRNKLEINTSLKAYLYRSVHNGALNRIRHSKTKAIHDGRQTIPELVYSEPASRKLDQSELEREIANAISKLPEQCRLVFKLSRFEQMKYSEIANHLDISVKTVENHMGKALKLMREQLKDYLIWVLMFTHVLADGLTLL
jgi:RNA polymerase sigma-70 factor, ECF subfamily